MKRMIRISYILAGAALLSGSLLFAAETTMDDMKQKDECLLISKNCPEQGDTMQQRIMHLNKELAKGTDVYTREELNALEQKLDDTVKMLEFMTTGG